MITTLQKTKSRDILPILQKIGLGTLYFLFIYSVQFIFIPGGVGTRVLIGGAGAILVVLRVCNLLKKGKLWIDKDFLRVLMSLALLASIIIFTMLINGSADRSMVMYCVSLCVILMAAYAVSCATRRVHKMLTFEQIAHYIILATVFQMVLALVMFLVPAIQSTMLSLTIQSDFNLALFDNTGNFRILGFGTQFFGAGVINGFVLILIGAMVKNPRCTLSIGFLISAFLLITFVGAMMARTTLIGSALGIGVMFWNTRLLRLKLTARFLHAVKIVFLICCICGAMVIALPSSIRDTMGDAMEFGFEMFYNYAQDGEFSSASTDDLGSMYDVYPTQWHTWVIGDGMWLNAGNEFSYYAGVDVGYTRLIFYCGIIGTLCYLFYQATLLQSINDHTQRRYQLILLVFFLYLLILNLKGFSDLTQMLSLFLFISPQRSTDNINNL